MSSTLTQEEEQRIAEWLAKHPTLTKGVGTAKAACSVAAWNLALTGTLTDQILDCASEVIGKWIIGVQDSCPPEHGRGNLEWLRLLPLAAGTGRQHEAERLVIVMNWMWGTVLPSLQPVAERHGFGDQWRVMLSSRTADATAKYAADAARYATDAAEYAADAAEKAAAAADAANAARYAARYAAGARYAADAAEFAADASRYAAGAARYAADAAADAAGARYAADAAKYAAEAARYAEKASGARYAADAAKYAAEAARYAADVARYAAAENAGGTDAWATFAPVDVLRQLIAVTDPRAKA